MTRLWLKQYPFDSTDSNDVQRDSTLTRLISLIFTADSTLTRLIWVRVESNLTHDSWVEHNPAQTGPGSTQVGPGSTQASPRSTQTGPGTTQTGPGSSQAGHGSTQEGSESTLAGPGIILPWTTLAGPGSRGMWGKMCHGVSRANPFSQLLLFQSRTFFYWRTVVIPCFVGTIYLIIEWKLKELLAKNCFSCSKVNSEEHL